MGDNGRPAVSLHQIYRLNRFRQGANLVHFAQQAVGRLALKSCLNAIDVGHQQIVTDDLNPVSQLFHHQRPTVPIILVEPIFNRNNGILIAPVYVKVDHLRTAQHLAFRFQMILTIFIKFRCSRIHSQHDLLARFVASLSYCFQNQIQRLAVGRQFGGKPAFVACSRAIPFIAQHLLQILVYFSPPAQRLAERGSAYGHHHKLLQIGSAGGVLAAVHNVHHGHGQGTGINTAQIPVQRHLLAVGGGVGYGQRNAQNGVGT